jgi:hypothetical protein
MHITSNILGFLAETIKLAVGGPHETEITVPPALQPVIALRNTLRTLNPAGTDLQSSSFAVEFNFLVANGGAQTVNFATIDAGAWELDIQVCYSSNYLSGVAGFDLQFSLAGSNANWFRIRTEQAGCTVVVNRTLRVQFAGQSVFTGILGANGVGNSHRAHIQILASRLI